MLRRPQQLQPPEDAVTFGRRLRFIDLPYQYNNEQNAIPWPCLYFANISELLTVLGNRGMLQCPHMLRRINVEYLQHLHHDDKNNKRQQQPPKDDPVVFLFGSKTPGGSRIVFPCGGNRTDESSHHENDASTSLSTRSSTSTTTTTLPLKDYKESISYAVDTMGSEPCFMDALNETSPILGDLLAQELASPDRLPDAANGEHAPAA